MYDHNQTLVPESFMALHLRHGRPTLERSELEARYETAETLALQIADALASVSADDAGARRIALRSVKATLLAAPAGVSEPEAQWVVLRTAEILGWPEPDFERADDPRR